MGLRATSRCHKRLARVCSTSRTLCFTSLQVNSPRNLGVHPCLGFEPPQIHDCSFINCACTHCPKGRRSAMFTAMIHGRQILSNQRPDVFSHLRLLLLHRNPYRVDDEPTGRVDVPSSHTLPGDRHRRAKNLMAGRRITSSCMSTVLYMNMHNQAPKCVEKTKNNTTHTSEMFGLMCLR